MKTKKPNEDFAEYNTAEADLSKTEREFLENQMALFNLRTINSNLKGGVTPSTETNRISLELPYLATMSLPERSHIPDYVTGSIGGGDNHSGAMSRRIREKSSIVKKTATKSLKSATKPSHIKYRPQLVLSSQEPQIILGVAGEITDSIAGTPIPSHTISKRLAQENERFGLMLEAIKGNIDTMKDDEFLAAVEMGKFDRSQEKATSIGMGGSKKGNVGSVLLVGSLDTPTVFLPPILNGKMRRAFGLAYNGPTSKKPHIAEGSRQEAERQFSLAPDFKAVKKILKPMIRRMVKDMIFGHVENARFLKMERPLKDRYFHESAKNAALRSLYVAILDGEALTEDDLKGVERNLRRKMYDTLRFGQPELKKCARFTRAVILTILSKIEG